MSRCDSLLFRHQRLDQSLSRLQFDHRQRRQRMRAESFESQLHEAPMKPGARPTSEHRPDERSWKPECSQPARHVDPIGSSEWLDERVVVGVGGRDLVVVRDHPFDLSDPGRPTVGGEVLACERDGRRDVVEGLVGPDPEVVEDRGDAIFSTSTRSFAMAAHRFTTRYAWSR